MQEPEQWQPSGQEWQASEQDSEYRADYPGRYEPQQQEKIYPQEERRLHRTAPGVLAIILSSIGFFLAVAGIVVSAIILQRAAGQQEWLVGGVIGLVGSIVVLLVCVAIFVIAVVMLAGRTKSRRRRMGTRA